MLVILAAVQWVPRHPDKSISQTLSIQVPSPSKWVSGCNAACCCKQRSNCHIPPYRLLIGTCCALQHRSERLFRPVTGDIKSGYPLHITAVSGTTCNNSSIMSEACPSSTWYLVRSCQPPVCHACSSQTCVQQCRKIVESGFG